MAKENPYLDVQHLTKSFGSLVLFNDLGIPPGLDRSKGTWL